MHLSYSTNVHPAESLADLTRSLREHVAPISRGAFGDTVAAVNLRVGMRQVDELLAHSALPSNSYVSDEILSAQPSPACREFLNELDALKLDIVSINAFPIRDFHAPRVKEQVYSPPWTDGGRALYSLKIAKAMTHFMARKGVDRKVAAISVPSGVFTGLYPESEDVQMQCAHFITECVRELHRLERLTGRTVQLGFEPEPMTLGETCGKFITYFKYILADAREKFPKQLGVTRTQAEEIARRFVTINLDLCHQAVEFEDPEDDLKQLAAAGITLSGLHLSAALALKDPARNSEGWARLKGLDEPRYLHQIVAKLNDGSFERYSDLPDLWNPRRSKGKSLEDFAELRCHFHVPLFIAGDTDMGGGLTTTVQSVPPAVRYALKHNLTDNFIAETYTWNVLAGLAEKGNAGAKSVVGSGGVDVHAGIVKELLWAQSILKS